MPAGFYECDDGAVRELGAFIGEWTLAVAIPDAPQGRVLFEWMPGERFLIERWDIPHPDAPDGVAIMGYDEGRGTLLQHYFDSRGVARVYEMGLKDGVWTLSRTKPDFSPLKFWQRFAGRFSADGRTIEGTWEISDDAGATWERDFDLTFRKVA
jgi:hypothetical protein